MLKVIIYDTDPQLEGHDPQLGLFGSSLVFLLPSTPLKNSGPGPSAALVPVCVHVAASPHTQMLYAGAD